jgi:hypothetical protein
VELAAGAPTKWVITLHDGSAVEIWADSAEGSAGPDDTRDYTFCSLMDIDEAEQDGFEIVDRTPSNPRRVLVAVARFPRSAVARTDELRQPFCLNFEIHPRLEMPLSRAEPALHQVVSPGHGEVASSPPHGFQRSGS